MSGCQSLQVVAVTCEDLASTSNQGLCHDKCVDGVCRAGRSEELTSGSPVLFRGVRYRTEGFEDPVDRSVSRATTHRLCDHYHGNLDRGLELQGSGQECPRSGITTGERDDSSGVQN